VKSDDQTSACHRADSSLKLCFLDNASSDGAKRISTLSPLYSSISPPFSTLSPSNLTSATAWVARSGVA
jgi:hypothetical protein